MLVSCLLFFVVGVWGSSSPIHVVVTKLVDNIVLTRRNKGRFAFDAVCDPRDQLSGVEAARLLPLSWQDTTGNAFVALGFEMGDLREVFSCHVDNNGFATELAVNLEYGEYQLAIGPVTPAKEGSEPYKLDLRACLAINTLWNGTQECTNSTSYFQKTGEWQNIKFSVQPSFEIALPKLSRGWERYLEFLARSVTGMADRLPGRSPVDWKVIEYRPEVRNFGFDWPDLAGTMIGRSRVRHFGLLLRDVYSRGILGDVLEAGVWRGGASLYAREVIRAVEEDFFGGGEVEKKRVILADSFEGLPRASRGMDASSAWASLSHVKASLNVVVNRFLDAGALEEEGEDWRVGFLKGFFNETLENMSPMVTAFVEQGKQRVKFVDVEVEDLKLSVLRVDADMYESTMDVLEKLYEKVQIGGYVILDDWGSVIETEAAVRDFRFWHDIKDPIVVIDDGHGAHWRKEANVLVDRSKWWQRN